MRKSAVESMFRDSNSSRMGRRWFFWRPGEDYLSPEGASRLRCCLLTQASLSINWRLITPDQAIDSINADVVLVTVVAGLILPGSPGIPVLLPQPGGIVFPPGYWWNPRWCPGASIALLPPSAPPPSQRSAGPSYPAPGRGGTARWWWHLALPLGLTRQSWKINGRG